MVGLTSVLSAGTDRRLGRKADEARPQADTVYRLTGRPLLGFWQGLGASAGFSSPAAAAGREGRVAMRTILSITCSAGALRRLPIDDLCTYQFDCSDALAGRSHAWSPITVAEATAFSVERSPAPLRMPSVWAPLAIAAAGPDALLGDVGVLVSEDRSEAEIGFTVSPGAQRRGIAAATLMTTDWRFCTTPPGRVVGITDARDLSSLAVLRRAGKPPVPLREVVFRGEPCREVILALACAGACLTALGGSLAQR